MPKNSSRCLRSISDLSEYEFQRDDGEAFCVPIPAFVLLLPAMVH